jgi:hypothetical protein
METKKRNIPRNSGCNGDTMGTESMNDKYLDIISTFWVNTASVAFRPTLMALIRSETHSKALQAKIAEKAYEDSAKAYYARHGTLGEF